MEDCVFCRLVRGDADCSKVYEDDKLLAFMDVRPVNSGHMLVIPKAHFKLVTELDDMTTARIFMVAKRLNAALKKSGIKCEAVTYLVADGESAKQEVPHVHLHIIPRYDKDGFGMKFPRKRTVQDRGDLNETAVKIRGSLGIGKPVPQ
jgi:histidine triad (HIT) family protein